MTRYGHAAVHWQVKLNVARASDTESRPGDSESLNRAGAWPGSDVTGTSECLLRLAPVWPEGARNPASWRPWLPAARPGVPAATLGEPATARHCQGRADTSLATISFFSFTCTFPFKYLHTNEKINDW